MAPGLPQVQFRLIPQPNHREDPMRRVIIVAITAVLASLVGWAPAEARTCPPPTVGGKTVATMNVKGRTVPVKSVTFRNGGLLDPPATNQAAGLSKRNMPLGARKGATVITWHVRYGNGCNGTLNPLMTMPIGSTFTAGAVGKPAEDLRHHVPRERLEDQSQEEVVPQGRPEPARPADLRRPPGQRLPQDHGDHRQAGPRGPRGDGTCRPRAHDACRLAPGGLHEVTVVTPGVARSCGDRPRRSLPCHRCRATGSVRREAR